MAFGMQSVMFAWLVTMVLHETPEKVGLAQMALLLPGTLLILVGGSYADRYGGKRVAMLGQLLAMSGPLLLTVVIMNNALSFSMMIAYAVLMGVAQAFVNPGRDGLLNHVAEGRIQRVVMLTSVAQFGLQIAGILVASLADTRGPITVLLTQSIVLLLGVVALSRIHTDRPANAVRIALWQSVKDGALTVAKSPAMRMVSFQNIAMALFFMGSYIVTMPLLIREVFAGSARELSILNGFNSLGLVLTILVVLRLGDVRRQGRALLLAQGMGAIILAGSAFAPSFWLFVFGIFLWGVCGGLAMTMSRTIVQELAPAGLQGRVMAFYGLTFMGAGPLGALCSGYLVERFGPQMALFTSGSLMLMVILIVGFSSSLWRVRQ